jgi:hypothetical protein
MKIFLTAAGITLIIAGCHSGKSKEETKPVINKDTTTAIADSGNHPATKDTGAAKETDLGSIGEISLGLSQLKTTTLLGQPDSKSKAAAWGADGLMHQDWFYKNKGITLNMSSNKNLAEQEIFSISITGPCAFKTPKNIGVGSSYNEVMAAYEKDIDKTATTKTNITVGSVYGGIMIDFTNDKVAKIFIGASAE